MPAEHIGTKTAVQIRSHAQKFFNKLEKKKEAGEAPDKGVCLSDQLEGVAGMLATASLPAAAAAGDRQLLCLQELFWCATYAVVAASACSACSRQLLCTY